MATQAQHITQWKHNRSLLGLIPQDYPDWIVTVCFYTALQAVDALLCHDKVTGVTKHEIRNRVLIDTNRYQKIKECYLPLYDLSRTVRYLADPEKWIPFEKIDKEVLRGLLYPLERSVQSLMRAKLDLELIHLGEAGTRTLSAPAAPTPPSNAT